MKITFVLRNSTTDNDLLGNISTVYPAFPIVNETKQKLETSKTWQKSHQTKNTLPENIVVDNVFTELQIVSLDYRSEGGRAYKVWLTVGDKLLLVDLREDALLDILANIGIQANGKIVGESFTFVMEGSQTKIVRVGSKIHETFVKKSEMTKAVGFEYGKIYTSKDGSQFVYLGKLKTNRIDKIENKRRYTTEPYYTYITSEKPEWIQLWANINAFYNSTWRKDSDGKNIYEKVWSTHLVDMLLYESHVFNTNEKKKELTFHRINLVKSKTAYPAETDVSTEQTNVDKILPRLEDFLTELKLAIYSAAKLPRTPDILKLSGVEYAEYTMLMTATEHKE